MASFSCLRMQPLWPADHIQNPVTLEPDLTSYKKKQYDNVFLSYVILAKTSRRMYHNVFSNMETLNLSWWHSNKIIFI